jgi:hypothetical protein
MFGVVGVFEMVDEDAASCGRSALLSHIIPCVHAEIVID